jgi:hypothetical protein
VTEFEQHLIDQKISAYEVSIRAYVRLEVVQQAIRNIPISRANAQKIRQALWEAGAAYAGYVAVYPDAPAEQPPLSEAASLSAGWYPLTHSHEGVGL